MLQRYDIVRALNASALNPSNTKGFSKTAFNNALTKVCARVTSVCRARRLIEFYRSSFTFTTWRTLVYSLCAQAYGATAVLGCDSKGWISTAVQCISKDLTLIRCPANVASKCAANTVFLPATQV